MHISPHLVRAPEEPVDEVLRAFYDRLLVVLKRPTLRDGGWSLLDVQSAWDGNRTADDFIAWSWTGRDGQRLLVAVNFSPDQGQCYVRLPFDELGGHAVRLRDALGDATYDRGGDELLARGLYLDIPGWAFHAFEFGSS